MAYTPPGRSRERIFRFVRRRLLEGHPPTVREVQQAFGFRAVQSARAHLEALVEEGRLVKESGKARGYRLPEVAGEAGVPRLVPLLGRVPAGPLDLAVEEIDGYLPVRSRHEDEELFALRVRGDSMRDAGIMENDLVIVRRQAAAETGDIVVALIGDEATVKTLHVKGRRVELRPENPAYTPIHPDPEELMILGKVIEVRRYLEGSARVGGAAIAGSLPSARGRCCVRSAAVADAIARREARRKKGKAR